MKTIASLEDLLALKHSDLLKKEGIALALENYPHNGRFTAKMQDFRERHYQPSAQMQKLKAKKFIPSLDGIIKFPESAFTDLVSAPILVPYLAYVLIRTAYHSRKQRSKEFVNNNPSDLYTYIDFALEQ